MNVTCAPLYRSFTLDFSLDAEYWRRTHACRHHNEASNAIPDLDIRGYAPGPTLAVAIPKEETTAAAANLHYVQVSNCSLYPPIFRLMYSTVNLHNVCTRDVMQRYVST